MFCRLRCTRSVWALPLSPWGDSSILSGAQGNALCTVGTQEMSVEQLAALTGAPGAAILQDWSWWCQSARVSLSSRQTCPQS